MNLSKSGISLSFGTRGAHYTLGSKGRRTTLGIPGTGLFYTSNKKSRDKSSISRRHDAPSDLAKLEQQITGIKNGKKEKK